MAEPFNKTPWFRMFTKVARCQDLLDAPCATRWAWVVLLAIARDCDPWNGYAENGEQTKYLPLVLRVGSKPVDAIRLSRIASITRREAQSALDHFVEREMLAERDDGSYEMTNWADYNRLKTLTSTGRTQEYRARKAEEEGDGPPEEADDPQEEEKDF